jgi:hypothetical protein
MTPHHGTPLTRAFLSNIPLLPIPRASPSGLIRLVVSHPPYGRCQHTSPVSVFRTQRPTSRPLTHDQRLRHIPSHATIPQRTAQPRTDEEYLRPEPVHSTPSPYYCAGPALHSSILLSTAHLYNLEALMRRAGSLQEAGERTRSAEGRTSER